MAPVGFLETGVIYCDDNLHRLPQFPAECVDLIYLDPPFFTNRHYEVIWGDEAEVRSFEDRWEGGIHVYVAWMRERLIEMHRILKPTGSLYLHCDPTASHNLKVMVDDVFGRENFRNEIIWKRTSGHSDARGYGAVHDVILYYVKTQGGTWNTSYQPYEPGYTEQYYRYKDQNGRRFMSADASAAGLSGGGYEYEWKGIMRVWRMPRETMEKMEAEGRIFYTRNGFPRIKRYLDESKGMPVQDVWTDIEAIRSWHEERLGYPTQKPVALMKRILEASSDKGDIVLDPFCGCGTTLVAAQLLGRQWIGLDISPTAVRVMRERLRKAGAADVKLIGMPVTEGDVRKLKPFEFQNWVIGAMNGSHSNRQSGDMGIDGFSFMLHEPIQVKQSDHIGRNVVDNFETALKRAGKTKGYIVAFSFGRGAREEVARVKVAEGLTIDLVTVASLLEGTADLVTPEPGLFGPEAPMPEPRAADSRPSVEDLIASESGEPLGQVAEPSARYEPKEDSDPSN